MKFLKVATKSGGKSYSMYSDNGKGHLSIITYGANARAVIETVVFGTLSAMRAFVARS